jgi:uncharacterized protein YcgI (DUF1989 family)
VPLIDPSATSTALVELVGLASAVRRPALPKRYFPVVVTVVGSGERISAGQVLQILDASGDRIFDVQVVQSLDASAGWIGQISSIDRDSATARDS